MLGAICTAVSGRLQAFEYMILKSLLRVYSLMAYILTNEIGPYCRFYACTSAEVVK